MFEQKEKIIDDLKFMVSPFPAGEAIRLQAYLMKLLGPAFARMVGAIKSGSLSGMLDQEIDGEAAADALRMLFSVLDEDTLMALIQRLLKNVICDFPTAEGKVLFDFTSKFDERLTIVFQGKLLTIYKVMFFVLEVNYPDFFLKIKSGIGFRKTTPPSALGEGSGTTSLPA